MNQKDKEKLQKLLKRYLENKTTPEEEAFINHWYENLEVESPIEFLKEEDVNFEQRKNWTTLNARLSKENQPAEKAIEPKVIRLQTVYKVLIGVAAAMLLALGLAFYEVVFPEKVLSPELGYINLENKTKGVQRINLPDGSLVWLEPGAGISYPEKFKGASRDITFKGKAFFDVARVPRHPFRVKGTSVEVKVLGTSFSLNFNAHKPEADVLVRSGKVAVTPTEQNLPSILNFLKPEKATLLLKANEQATLKETAETLVKRNIQPGFWEKQVINVPLTYTDTPLGDVIRQLEDQHKVSIRLDNKQLLNCTLTAYFYNQPLKMKLEMICKSIGANYKVADDKFILSGEGCY